MLCSSGASVILFFFFFFDVAPESYARFRVVIFFRAALFYLIGAMPAQRFSLQQARYDGLPSSHLPTFPELRRLRVALPCHHHCCYVVRGRCLNYISPPCCHDATLPLRYGASALRGKEPELPRLRAVLLRCMASHNVCHDSGVTRQRSPPLQYMSIPCRHTRSNKFHVH